MTTRFDDKNFEVVGETTACYDAAVYDFWCKMEVVLNWFNGFGTVFAPL